jgi:two-component system, NarL family, sensor histidine kinase DesK
VTASAAMPRERTDPEPPALLGPGGTVALFAFLLFLGFPVVDFLQGDPSATHLALTVAALVAFVGIYLRVMLAAHPPRETALSISVMAVIALALGLDSSAEWATLFVYVAAACGFRLPAPGAERGIAAATVAVGALSFGHGYPVDDSISYVLYALAIGALLRGYAHLVALNDELRAARGEIARLAVGEERLRFARDLHDLLGHSLSVIALKSELARRVLRSDPERAEHEVRDIERVTRDSLVEVREAVGGYRRMTLAAELRGARAALGAAGIAAEIPEATASFPPEVETLLAWAVREGTTNVIRHSGARRCAIRIHAGLAEAGVEIVDDGGPPHAGIAAEGSGLAGLEERVRRRAGRLEAGRRPEGGFRLAIDVPANP